MCTHTKPQVHKDQNIKGKNIKFLEDRVEEYQPDLRVRAQLKMVTTLDYIEIKNIYSLESEKANCGNKKIYSRHITDKGLMSGITLLQMSKKKNTIKNR